MAFQIAFYGTGDQALPYLRALARRQDVSLVATCDLDRRAAEQVAAGWGARVFLSYEAMLEESRPEALWICVEPHLQGDIILKAVESGIPFFVDPPGALNFDRARVYGKMVASAGLVTAAGFLARYTDVFQEAREYVGKNHVPLGLGWWLHPKTESQGMEATNLLWNEGCKLVDALRFFCGEIERIRALSAGTGQGGLVVQLEFASGTVGVLTCSTYARPETRRELELLGEGWSLIFGNNLSILHLAEQDKTTIIRCLNDPATDATNLFLEAISKGDPSGVAASYADALRTLSVCHAAALSAKENRLVDMAKEFGDLSGNATKEEKL